MACIMYYARHLHCMSQFMAVHIKDTPVYAVEFSILFNVCEYQTAYNDMPSDRVSCILIDIAW